jgi:hypothetical protein
MGITAGFRREALPSIDSTDPVSHDRCCAQALNLGDDADRLRWSRIHGLLQDEEERGGVANRGARDERGSAIRRLQAISLATRPRLLGEARGACGRGAGVA